MNVTLILNLNFIYGILRYAKELALSISDYELLNNYQFLFKDLVINS